MFDGASLSQENGTALNLNEARVPGSVWLRFAESPKGAVSLERAQVGALTDFKKTWPSELRLGGLTYEHLESRSVEDERAADASVEERLAWLKLEDGYAPQPYEQLVAFYRRAGREQEARKVAIQKQRRRRDKLPLLPKVGSFFLDWTVGYGYRAWQAGLWLMGLVVVGSVAFHFAYPRYFTPAPQTGGLPHFQSVLYTLDLVLPVVNLHERDTWIAVGPAQWGALLTIAGWVLATAAVAALTGLLKRD